MNSPRKTLARIHAAVLALAMLAALCLSGLAAQEDSVSREPLVMDQKAVQERMREVEKRLLELAQRQAAQDPIQSGQLLDIVASSRKAAIADKMARAAALLKEQRYVEAMELQRQVLESLDTLLSELSAQQWRAELGRLESFGKSLEDLLARQKKATEAAEPTAQMLREQQEIKQATDKLLEQMKDVSAPGLRSMNSASASMAQALKTMQADRVAAQAHQREAGRGLEEALKGIRRAITKLKDRWQRELLLNLEGMLRDMLSQQEAITADTANLNLAIPDIRQATRQDRLRAGDLAARERRLGSAAGNVTELLKQDGTTAGLPTIMAMLRGDMEEVARRLDEAQTGEPAQQLERGIEGTLKSIIAALQEELARRTSNPQWAERQAAER